MGSHLIAYDAAGGWWSVLPEKLFSTQFLIRDFGAPLGGLLCAAVGFVVVHWGRLRKAGGENRLLVVLGMVFVVVFLFHYTPRQVVREYHTVILPLLTQ